MNRYLVLAYRGTVLALLAANLFYLIRIERGQYSGPDYNQEQQARSLALDVAEVVKQLKFIEQNTRRN